MTTAVIELKSVSVQFGSEGVLQNIDATVQSGEIFVLIGPSGQGKSLLLKLMAGIQEPSTGEVFVEGKDLNRLGYSARNQLVLKMGMLFQKNALFDSLSCGENIAFPLREVGHLSEAEIQERVSYFLNEVGISHAKNLFPDEISGGMQKRLGIARALALDPEIIFYDDPTAGLDPITSRKIIDLILRLQKQRKSTVVAVTNDMNRAYQMCHRIAMVVQQELIITGDESATRAHPDPRVQQFIRGERLGPLTGFA